MISTRKRVSQLMGLALGCSMMIATPSYAVPYIWTDWTSSTIGIGASGTVGGIGVTFSGDVSSPTQVSGVIDYWATDSAIYTGGGVDNGPTPNSDIIALTGGSGAGTQTLTFLSDVTDPVLAILSLGQTGIQVNYDFDTPFTILNDGPGGFWDPGDTGTLTASLGDVLEGVEGHGIIKFSGAFGPSTTSTITWTINTPTSSSGEFWHGFTVGIASVPEPASLMLLGAGLAGIGIWRRKAAKGEK